MNNQQVMRKKAGFTLAELLAAMMVFSIIMLACASLVNQAGKSFKAGLNQVERQDAGRSVRQELAMDLSSAFVSAAIPFAVDDDRFNLGTGRRADALFMHSMTAYRYQVKSTEWTISNQGSEPDDSQDVMYWVEPIVNSSVPNDKKGVLYKREYLRSSYINYTRTANSYKRGTYQKLFLHDDDPAAASGADPLQPNSGYTSVLAENVWSFKTTVYDQGGAIVPNYYSKNQANQLPARVEIELELLDEETWAKQGSVTDFDKYVKDKIQTIRFSHSFSNRGY